LSRPAGKNGPEFCNRHGDWGRDAALWLGRKHGRLTLKQLRELSGGGDYAAVGQAVSRFGKRLEQQRDLRQTPARIENELLYV
jgi:hypothetical protein